MQYPAGFSRQSLALAGIMACGALASPGTTAAQAQNLASCQFQSHIVLMGGSFFSDGGQTASCSGLISGGLAGAAGTFETLGSYDPGACMIDSWQGSFTAQVPQAIYFFTPQYAVVSGSVQLTKAGQAFVISGQGTVNRQPVRYEGTGSFTPDGGQACWASAGTLTERLLLTDGGDATPSHPSSPPSPSHHRKHQRHHNKSHSRRHHAR